MDRRDQNRTAIEAGDHSIERRLAAIFAADVAGYSRLMNLDEVGTLRVLTGHRLIMDKLVLEYGGRIANTAGDSVLAEFPSAVGAVQCAVAVQEALAQANLGIPAENRLLFRIGIHVGDVMVRGGDLLGDGVNIAARLESIAEPGGVSLSSDAYSYIRKTLPLDFQDLGMQRIKNLGERIRIFALKTKDRMPEPRASPTPPSKARKRKSRLPCIAVLPFTNMSDDKETDYFADGVAEEIIIALSHLPRLVVIARNTTFAYKNQSVDVKEVGRKLHAHYVLEGSVRRAGERLRIVTQLLDATTGGHLWAEHFDGTFGDIFDFQDHITRCVVGAISPRLMAAEVERAMRQRPDSLAAYDLFLRALPAFREMTREGNERALQLVEQALALDPNYAVAAGLGAWAYTLRLAQNWRVDPEAERRRGIALARIAIAKGHDDAEALAMGGYALAFLGEELEEGLEVIERSISLNPSDAVTLTHAGWVRCYLGRPGPAIEDFERSLRLSPHEPTRFRAEAGLSFAYLLQEDFDHAVAWGRKALATNPNYTSTHYALASALGHQGRAKEARAVIDRLLEVGPYLTLSAFSQYSLLRFSGRIDHIVEGLRMAGLPE